MNKLQLWSSDASELLGGEGVLFEKSPQKNATFKTLTCASDTDKQHGGKLGRRAYHEELNAFVLTLHCYSAQAYDFIRQSFKLALPHPRHIRTWYAQTNGDPGFRRCTFTALSSQVKTDAETKR